MQFSSSPALWKDAKQSTQKLAFLIDLFFCLCLLCSMLSKTICFWWMPFHLSWRRICDTTLISVYQCFLQAPVTVGKKGVVCVLSKLLVLTWRGSIDNLLEPNFQRKETRLQETVKGTEQMTNLIFMVQKQIWLKVSFPPQTQSQPP